MNEQNSLITEIQNKANIVEIISDYVKLESHGKNYFGICPFHDDHSPSMSVNKEKGIYKCFVCGATGRVFKFVQDYLGVSFLDAVKIVADKIGVNFTIYEKKENLVNKRYYDIMNLSTLFYANNLRSDIGEEARKYLYNRGINDDIIKDFDIGLSLKEDDALYKLLTKKDYNNRELAELGLIAKGDKGIYDLFRNRIIFPLKSPTGKVNGFSGRIFDSKSSSKYINTRETVIFKKRENLYNYHLAEAYAHKDKFIVICEGFMDAIRIYSVGIKNVVATMGTALAKEQIELLKKLNVKVIIVMDNDDAGEMATASIGKGLMKEGIDIGVVRLTGKKDPDEYILEYGAEAFEENLRRPMSYIDFMKVVLRKSKNLSNPAELTTYINSLIELIRDIPDAILKETTINSIADEFHLDKELLKARIGSNETIEIKEGLKKEEKKKITTNTASSKFDRALMTMLYYMMNDTACMKLFLKQNFRLPESKYRLVANNLIYYFEINREIDFADYLTFTENYPKVEPVAKEIISTLSINSFKIDDMKTLISIIRNALNEEKIEKLKKEMAKELDVSRRRKLFEEIVEIKRGCVIEDE